MKSIFLTLSVIMTFSIFSCGASEKGRIVNKIMGQHAQHLKNKYQLRAQGIGSRIPDDVRGFIMDFRGMKKLNLEQSRILFVEATQNLLKSINSNQRLRPYMYKYPFDHRNVEYMIDFYTPSGEMVEEEYIAFIFNQDGKIHYESYDRQKDEFVSRHVETYEEALRIVQGKM